MASLIVTSSAAHVKCYVQRSRIVASETSIVTTDVPQVADIQKLIIPAGAPHSLQPKLHRVFELRKEAEWDAFNPAALPNVQMLFHGSSARNFAGLLSRG